MEGRASHSHASGKASPYATTRLQDLPVEIQLQIWDLVLEDVYSVQIQWARPPTVTSWRLLPIPQLGENDPLGMIPSPRPPGTPPTFAAFPLPHGTHSQKLFDEATFDYDWYYAMHCSAHKPTRPGLNLTKAWASRSKAFAGTSFERPQEPKTTIDTSVTALSLCHLSRRQALKHTIVDTNRPLRPNDLRDSGFNNLYPVHNGAVVGSVLRDNFSGRCCFAFIISDRKSIPTKPGHFSSNFDPSTSSYVFARLSDIEKCVLGSRLSLTQATDGHDRQRFEELRWATYFRPEMGSADRRPEACHPFNLDPGSITWIYSTILHHLPELEPDGYPLTSNCVLNDKRSFHTMDNWYWEFLEQGRCTHCRRDLRKELTVKFPGLMDSNGYLDILVARHKSFVEAGPQYLNTCPYQIHGFDT
ncbi:hypothetical protein F5Y15DRAFT_311754 [Xylariaceae sp. FL0016]|nr:hypothetical protein F5Y15DRAFT_311754 [Xylariaceae sp. FL0016]